MINWYDRLHRSAQAARQRHPPTWDFKEDETKEKVKELQNARGRIRGFLGKRIHLRYTPELDFKYDETTMRASRIEELLMEVKHDNDDNDSVTSVYFIPLVLTCCYMKLAC